MQEGAPMFSIADASKMCVDFKVSKYNLTNLASRTEGNHYFFRQKVSG